MDRKRRAALARAAERIAEWNVERFGAFQNSAMGEIHLAKDAFRDSEGELPPARADPAFDALMELSGALDASPAAVSRACDRALEAAGVLASHATEERAARLSRDPHGP